MTSSLLQAWIVKEVVCSLYVCVVNIKLKYNFVETTRKFIIAELSIRKLGSSSLMKIRPSLRFESFAIINLRGVFTKLYFN